MNRTLRTGLLSLGLITTGCYKIDYVGGPAEPVPAHTEWHHIGIFGLAEFSAPVQLSAICPQGFARVHNERSFLNGLTTWALGTVGLNWVYQPYTTTVYCRSGAAYNVELNADGLALSAEPVVPSAE